MHSLTSTVTGCNNFDYCASVNSSNGVAIPEEAGVTFLQPKTVAQVETWASAASVTSVELDAAYSGNDVVAIGYDVVPGTANLPNDYQSEMSTLAEDMRAQLAALNDPSAVASQIADLNTIDASLTSGNSSISQVAVEGSSSALSALSSNSSVSSVTRQSTIKTIQETTIDPDAGDAGSACTGTWAPNSGSVVGGPAGQANRRYMYQQFIWNSTRMQNLKSCRTNLTYEPDAHTNNLDGQYYFAHARSWGSNLPKAYYDTTILDSPFRPTFTVGTYDAQLLKANWYYYTGIHTGVGNVSTDTGASTGQRGHRYPSWCYHPLCVEGDQSSILVSEWNWSIPGIKNWTN